MMNIILGIGSVCLIALGIVILLKTNQQKKKKEQRDVLTTKLNYHLKSTKQIQINDHVVLKKNGDILDYEDIGVFYDGEFVAPLKEFQSMPETYDKLVYPIQNLSTLTGYIDKDNNGIDDRLEERKNGAYFVSQIGKVARYTNHPGILAGLKEICDLLNTIDDIETKYPQINSRLRKLYQHYLPMLLQIFGQLTTLQEKQASSEEISAMEAKLEKTVLLTSEAIKTIINGFVSEDLMSMNADMTVLETILKKDGLVREGSFNG